MIYHHYHFFSGQPKWVDGWCSNADKNCTVEVSSGVQKSDNNKENTSVLYHSNSVQLTRIQSIWFIYVKPNLHIWLITFTKIVVKLSNLTWLVNFTINQKERVSNIELNMIFVSRKTEKVFSCKMCYSNMALFSFCLNFFIILKHCIYL